MRLKNGIFVSCEWCENRFYRIPSLEYIKHCSQSCAAKHRINRDGLPKMAFKKGDIPWNKGVSMGLNPIHSEFLKELYSNPENHPRYVDGRSFHMETSHYPTSTKEWKSLSSQIRIRDNYICQKCGISQRTPRLDVHHIIPYLDGGPNEPENLVTLCRACHMKEDKKKKRGE